MAACRSDGVRVDVVDRYAHALTTSYLVFGQDAHLTAPRHERGWPFFEESLSRVFKASEDTHGLGVDAVHMSSPGPGHLHPSGEVDLCFALDGSPTFDGNPPGWTVYADGSWHVPTVTGGTMAILYFLPDGAIHFGPRPD